MSDDLNSGFPGRLNQEIMKTLGVLPNFFRQPPEVAEKLWASARGSYIDNLLPSCFKERLFVYLSRFCEVRYCIVRHFGFLTGHGHPSGDSTCAPLSVSDAARLLTRPIPDVATYEQHLTELERIPGPITTWPPEDSNLEWLIMDAAAQLFLDPLSSERARHGLQRVLGSQKYEALLLLLNFIRSAHFWTVSHPDLEMEEDTKALLNSSEELARRLLDDPAAGTRPESMQVLRELDSLREQVKEVETLRRIKAQLQESEERLRLAATAAGFGCYDYWVESEEFYWSEEMGAIFGMPNHPTHRMTAAEIQEKIHHEDRGVFSRMVANALDPTREGNHDIEFRIVHPDGSVRWLRDVGQSFYDGDGTKARVVRVIGTVQDITEQKKAEDDFHRQADMVHRFLEHSPFPAAIHAEDGTVITVSPAWTRITGYCPEDLQSVESWTRLAYGSERSFVKEHINRLFELDEMVEEGKFTIRTAHGEHRVWDFFSAPLGLDEQGRRLILSIAADVTEQRETEDKLRDAAMRLAESDRRKDEFLATLAHELRNPLAAIQAGVDLLEVAEDSPETVEEVRDVIARQTIHLTSLVGDLMEVSRVTRGKLRLMKRRIVLQDAVHSALETVRSQIDQLEHMVHITMPEMPMYLEADPNRLSQVVANLLSNAAKYTPPGGHIEVDVAWEENYVVITVKDNGVGIPESALESIFDMFVQVDQRFESTHVGLGIGLTLVRSLVEMHGGYVKAYSEGRNKGTEFQVRLPSAMSQEKVESMETQEPKSESSKRRVLVVDDNADAATLLSLIVKKMGHEVFTASDGRQAIATAEEKRPDAVLMDIGMPEMDGYEAARHIRRQDWGKDMLLVALTGWGQEQDKVRTKEAGFDRHLVKPAKRADVQDILANGR